MHTARTVVMGAFIAYCIANVIHNRFGLDPAVAPAALFVALSLWWPRRGIVLVAAAFIAVPSFAFLDWSALVDGSDGHRLANHAALLTGGVLALAGVAVSLLPRRIATPAVE